MNKSQKILVGFGMLTISNLVLADIGLLKISGGIRENTSDTSENIMVNSEVLDFKYKSAINGFTYYAQVQHEIPFAPSYRFTSHSNSIEYKSCSASKSGSTCDGSNLKLNHSFHELFYSFNFKMIEAQLGIATHSFTKGGGSSEEASVGVTANIIINVPQLSITPSLNFDQKFGADGVTSIGANLSWGLSPGVYLDLGIKNYVYKYHGTKDGIYKYIVNVNNAKFEDEIKKNTLYLGVSFKLGV